MSPNAQQVALAQALGWTKVGADDQMIGQRPGTPPTSSYAEELPDINDLNYLHDAWSALIRPDPVRALYYYRNLTHLATSNPDGTARFGVCLYDEVTNASAAHRCEAMLRVLGLWRSDK